MSTRGRVFYGVARLDLHLPGADGLKAKRARLRRAAAALERELRCSVAEVGEQDRWQIAVLGVAVAASTEEGVLRVVDRVVSLVERDPQVVVTRHTVHVDVLDEDDASLGWG